MLDMKQAAEHVLMLAAEKGHKDVDVVVERDDSLSIEIQDGKVEKVEQSTSLGLGVRVLDEGCTGLASTERLSQQSIAHAFQNACFQNKCIFRNAPPQKPISQNVPQYKQIYCHNQ